MDGKDNINKFTGLANNAVVKRNNLPRILGKVEKYKKTKKQQGGQGRGGEGREGEGVGNGDLHEAEETFSVCLK